MDDNVITLAGEYAEAGDVAFADGGEAGRVDADQRALADDRDRLEVGHRHALRLEGMAAQAAWDLSGRLGSWHCYLVMIICS